MRVLLTSPHSRLFKRGTEWMLDPQKSDIPLAATYRELQRAGHQVGFHATVPGQKLDYDLVVVEMSCATRTWGARQFLGAWWALAQARDGGVPAVAFFGHWDIRSTIDQLRQLHDDPTLLLDGFIQYANASHARPHDALLRHELACWMAGDPSPSMVNCYEWGDHSLLTTGTPLPGFSFYYDPSDLMPVMATGTTVPHRERRWVLATWESHRRWLKSQKLTWPVVEYGKPVHGRQRAELWQVCEAYTHSRGALVPPYYHAGSGYWRPRLQHTADAGAILGLAPKDAAVMDGCFQHELLDLEKMDDTTLNRIANDQREWFFDNVTPANVASKQLLEFLEGVA